ncbi:MAG TPA: hypothetical protein VGF11_10005 [Acidimicrobiales bacterium]
MPPELRAGTANEMTAVDLVTTPHAPEPAPTDPGPSPRPEARRIPVLRGPRQWPRWVLRPIAIYLASRVVTYAALGIATAISHKSLWGEIDMWDSRWFIRAASHGWPSHLPMYHGHIAANTTAFFPLFPLSFRWLATITGTSLLTAGAIVSGVTGMTAMIAVWALVRHYAGSRGADRATLLLAVFPGAFVFSMVYSEGLTITLIAFGLLALMRRRWLLAGLLGMAATATSPVAVAFVVSCAWCAYREIWRERNWRAIVAPVLAPLGFIAYLGWLTWHTGSITAWTQTERYGWHSYASLWYPIHLVASFLANPVAPTETNNILVAGIVVAVICATVAIRDRLPVPMLLYGLIAASISMVTAPVGLRPRFILLAFPLVLAIGTRLRGRSYGLVLLASTGMLVALTIYTVSAYGVFP